MEPIKVTVLKIEPSTHVRSTRGDSWLFAVSDEYIEEFDKKRTLLDPEAKPGRNMNRKRQLEKYNAYKQELQWLAKKAGFTVPHGYFAVWFYMPHPKSWRRKKIAENLYKPHQSTPDWDNCTKALFDALMPRKKRTKGEKGVDDRLIHCGAVFKVWVRENEGCIKILEYDQNEFMMVFKHGNPTYPS